MRGTGIISFVGGLGLFLFGLAAFEDAVKSLSGKALKTILRRYTNTRLKAITTGFFSTAIFQSSGLVSLVVMSFVGAGIIFLDNAVGIIIGMNIGAPITDVILGLLGLKFNVFYLALSIIGISGIVHVAFQNNKIKRICKLLFGLGLLFIGLYYIKESVMLVSASFDFSLYMNYGVFVYFLIGLVLTVLMQSSSAMIVIVLALASGGIITLPIGMSLIMGAYLGTTSTVMIGSLGGSPTKKQVALSHVFFNLFSIVVGFLLLKYMALFIGETLGFGNNAVMGLSVFAVGFKVFCSLLMLPFIKQFTLLLKKIVPDKKTLLNLEIEKVGKEDIQIAIGSMRNDAIGLIKKTFKYNTSVFDISNRAILDDNFELDTVLSTETEVDSEYLDKQYKRIKLIEEAIIKYGLSIKSDELTDVDIQNINNIHNVVSNAIYSLKYMKDVRLNIQDLEDSDSVFIRERYKEFKKNLLGLYKPISEIIDGHNNEDDLKAVLHSVKYAKENDRKFLSSISKDILKEQIDEFELSGLININRYLYLSFLSMILAIKDLFLSEKEKKIFDNVEL